MCKEKAKSAEEVACEARPVRGTAVDRVIFKVTPPPRSWSYRDIFEFANFYSNQLIYMLASN